MKYDLGERLIIVTTAYCGFTFYILHSTFNLTFKCEASF
jgi:hypothetical protein